MRKIVVNTFITLDGVMQAPGGPEEAPTGGSRELRNDSISRFAMIVSSSLVL